MAFRNILIDEDPLLRKTSREVEELTPRILELIDDMWDTLYEANGVGLAAPQVGILRRVVVIDATQQETEEGEADKKPKETLPPLKAVLINPRIVWTSDEEVSDKEGCLSVPGFSGIVSRPLRVRLIAMNENGEEFETEVEGLSARAVCHEIDHLDGILYTDKATEIMKVEQEDEAEE